MSLLILQEIPLKGSHFCLAEHRGTGACPDVPDHILSQSALFGFLGIITSSGVIFQNVVQCFSAILFSADLHLHETAVRIQGDTAVIQQIAVVNLVHAALGKQKFYMALQFLTAHEHLLQAQHDLALFLREFVRMYRIHRREIHVFHGIFFAVHADRLFLEIDPMQQHPIFHMELRVSHDQLSFQLELQDSNCFMHLGVQPEILGIVIGIELDGKGIAVGILISFQCKCSQRQQVDAVAILQRGEITVSGRHSDHISDTGQTSGRRAHPHHVMVAPLDIHGMVFAQSIHNNMRAGTSVVNITDDMQMIDDQLLDQVA